MQRMAALCLLLCGMRPGFAQQTVAEQYLFAALNNSRVAVGLPALRWDNRLTAAAAVHADAMRRARTMSHQLQAEPDLPERAAVTGSRFSAVAENIGVGSSAPVLHGMWMQSQHHRDNILDPAVDAVGIAVRERDGAVWAVEDFARTVPDVSLPEQEQRVVALLHSVGLLASPSNAARAMCEQDTGFVGRPPMFVVRYNATALTTLPSELLERIRHGTASQATVGACERPGQSFSTYNIAVALYP